jgi:hypothetical protein
MLSNMLENLSGVSVAGVVSTRTFHAAHWAPATAAAKHRAATATEAFVDRGST